MPKFAARGEEIDSCVSISEVLLVTSLLKRSDKEVDMALSRELLAPFSCCGVRPTA